MIDKRRITVIGGGIGGYPAAIKAARLGGQVTLIEKAEMGGTCLNRGCMPTKSLLQSVAVARLVKEAGTFGIKTSRMEIDFPTVMKRKDMVVRRLRKGVTSLVEAKKIKLIKGTAEIAGPKSVKIIETGEEIISDSLILATGSTPAEVPIPGLDQSGAWNSDDFLAMQELPATTAIIGGGVIGVELAQILAGFGREVSILEMLPQLAPGLDTEIALTLKKEMTRQGIKIITGAKVTKVSSKKDKRIINYRAGDKDQTLSVDKIIVAVGRRPAIERLNFKKIGLSINENAVQVNERMETSINDVYAVGDVTGGIMLAHVAAAEGECAAINAMGGDRVMAYKAVPSCIYTSPEVASVGLSEEQAGGQYEIDVGRFPFAGSGKAVVLNKTIGMVKIISDKKYGEILGLHIIGPHATDLIGEAVLAMTMEATAEEIAHAIHPHPTLSEAVMEAALSLTGGALHMP